MRIAAEYERRIANEWKSSMNGYTNPYTAVWVSDLKDATPFRTEGVTVDQPVGFPQRWYQADYVTDYLYLLDHLVICLSSVVLCVEPQSITVD